MALKAVLESLDGLSDAVKAEYTDAGDGTFRLNVEGADALVDTSGLKKTVKRLREENATLSAWGKAFPDKTPDEIAELVKQSEVAGGDKPDVVKLRRQIEETEATKYKPVSDERDALKAENKRLQMSDSLSKLALKAGVFEDDRLQEAIETALKVCDLDDKKRIVVLDEDGEVSAKTPEQFFTETLKAKKPWLFKAPDASGSDTGNARRARDAAASAVKSKKDLKTDLDKSNYISKHGHQAYIDLPRE